MRLIVSMPEAAAVATYLWGGLGEELRSCLNGLGPAFNFPRT